MRIALLIMLTGLLFQWGCGQDESTSGQVIFLDPDQVEYPQVVQASDAVVKLELYGHRGTGFFISGTGYLLTNHHVAGHEVCPRECAGLRVLAFQQRGRETVEYRGARLFFSDEDLDLALLKVDVGSDRVAFIRLSDDPPDLPVDGQWYVNVVGHPFGALKKATRGTIDFRNDDTYFIDAFIFPGNSGSPLLTTGGEAIGLVMAIYYWIGDIDHKGQYGDSGLATTFDRILEKYPLLLQLNADTPSADAETALDHALAGMDDGLPLDASALLAFPAATLVRGNAEMLTNLVAHLDQPWAFTRMTEFWTRVSDTQIFEEIHRYNAARALFFLAESEAERAEVYDLLAAHAPDADPDWRDSFLWLINQLNDPQSLSYSQNALIQLYTRYQLSPVLAAIFLAFGIRTLGAVDLLDECEKLFDSSWGRNSDYLVADYLDRFRFESADDEERVIKILRDIRKKSDRVRAVFYAEEALFNRDAL